MKYVFMATIYCETSMISTFPLSIYQHFKKVEQEKGDDYIASNEDYWISIYEMDKPNANQVTFESSQAFYDFMKGFGITTQELEESFNKMVSE